MVRGNRFFLLLLLLASVRTAAAALPPFLAGKKTLAGAYIIEYENGHNARSLSADADNHFSHFRAHYDFAHFRGASLQLRDNVTEANAIKALIAGRTVKNVWPVYLYEMPLLNASEFKPRRRSIGNDTHSAHVMMQIDQLRAKGFDGKGVKLAVIDTGVDYNHSALGGCFGTGCKISFGYDLVGDAFTGLNQPQPDNDPMDCYSHGTHISGIIAADVNEASFTGVAPGVTLGMYKVFGCHGVTRTDILMNAALRAAEDGASIISCSVGSASGWIDNAFAHVLNKFASEKGIMSTVAAGNDGSQGAFYPSGVAIDPLVNWIASADPAGTHSNDYTPSSFSSWGPATDMNLKPQFAAPGRDILSTLRDNKYGRASGTSMATPMAAGVMAVLSQALGQMTPQHMQTLLSSTAKPLHFDDGLKTYGVLAPVAQQGAGLIQAMNAFNCKTVVSVSNLAFNDTEHMGSGLLLTVSNAGREKVRYRLGDLSAISVYVLPSDGSPYPSSFPNSHVKASGNLHAEVISFVLKPGDWRTLRIHASPPSSRKPLLADTRRLVLWSGFLCIHSDNVPAVSVPYQGLDGSLRKATTLPAAGGVIISHSTDKKHRPVAADTLFVLPRPDSAKKTAAAAGGVVTIKDLDLPLVMPRLAFGTTTITAEIVRASSGMVVGALPGAPFTCVARGGIFGVYWDGGVAGTDGYVGRGTYKVRLSALRVFGDPANADDWDVSETVPIRISYKK